MKKFIIPSIAFFIINLVLVKISLAADLDLAKLRIDCYPEAPYLFGEVIDDKCRQRNCIWQSSTVPGVPWCFFPQESYGYTMINSTSLMNGHRIFLKRLTKYASPFPDPIDELQLNVEFINKNVFRFKLFDSKNKRYEVPVDLNDIKDNNNFNSEFIFTFENRNPDSVFVFKITRASTGTVLFDTSLGGMIFNDQYIQIATFLPKGSNLYGFGENNHASLSHDMNYRTWGMWARDEPNVAGENLNQYGVQPVYNVLEEDGNAHGVMILNSNAMEYSTMPNPGLVFKTIGGVLDFYFFSGPEPESVVKQYTSLVGLPFMPPYFSLGFQLSRWNYQDLNDLKMIVERNLAAGIPLDIQYADIEHFQNNMDFTINEQKFKNLPDYIHQLQSRGMHVVPILDPALVIDRGNLNYKPYLTGVSNDVFIKWPSGQSPDYNEMKNDIMIGYCWPDDKVAYPDFLLNRTKQWWIDQILEYRKVNFTFDALWIDMNEPAVFDTNEEKPWNWPPDKLPYWTLKCPVNKYDDPPYRTINAYRYDSKDKKARLSQKTLCLMGLQDDGKLRHYDVHNIYGLSESIATQKATRLATGKRSFILSRSTFVGTGRYSGHWLGDNDSSYKDMQRSIIGMIENGIFGIPYIGADICGFTSETTEELCLRWQQVGAFYPYSRNHNVKGSKDQDPASFSQTLISSTKNALNVRYTILPYYYTLFYKAHTTGSLVVKGLFQEFPYNRNCRAIDRQFLVGPAFLVSPVLEPGKTSVNAYFPIESRWYSYYDGALISSESVTLIANLSMINLHVRGGYIIPTQNPANNTVFSRKNPFGLIVALDNLGTASGDLFYDDGDSIDSIQKSNYYFSKFVFNEKKLKMTVTTNNFAEMSNLKLDTVRIFGLIISKSEKLEIRITKAGGTKLTVLNIANVDINEHGEIKLNNLNLKMNEDFEIDFKSSTVTENINLNDDRLRADCYPEPNASENLCLARKCKWSPSQYSGVPWCFIDKQRVSYTVESETSATVLNDRYSKEYLIRKLDSLSYYGQDMNKLKITVEKKGSGLLRIKMEDYQNKRYEVPIENNWSNPVNPNIEGELINNDFDVYIGNDYLNRFILEVYRKSTGLRLISTREYAESYVFSDRYQQLFLRLASENVFGFGENTHESFKHSFNTDSLTYSVFARDDPPTGGSKALYGTQPFYMSVEHDGKAHGLLILNSNAQEYKFSSLKSFMFRTIGGIFDIYMFSGPTPENVIQQYTKLIGVPFFPPYYALGFQLSRYGYNTIENLKGAIDRTVNANIPFDIQHGDIDHFERQKDFTYDKTRFKDFPAYVDQLKSRGIRFIPIVDPALVTNENDYMPYIRGMQKDVWIKWPQYLNPQASETINRNMLGYVWPEGKVLFPDFFNNKTIDWWADEITTYYQTIKFDGLWIDMNEPANFGTNQEKPFNYPANLPPWSLKCPNNSYDDPPYRTNAAYGDRLSDKTLCLVGEQTDGNKIYKQYDVHNLFGYTQTTATHIAMLRARPNKRPLVITRSTFPGSGHRAGHWLGDNTSGWKHLKYNIIGSLEFNLFGIPYVGADVCGFFEDADAELCTRWMQLGAFNTFFRNHNGLYGTDQDPGAYGATVAENMRKSVVVRYTLLPYLYTLFFNVNVNGGTVSRSLVHEFPTDTETYSIDEQFMWGSHLLISPVIYPGLTAIDAYLPIQARWYDYYTGKEVTNGRTRLSAPIDFIPLHIRGNSILPFQEPGLNTDESRKNPFGLIIAPDSVGNASGTLYWDDGESYDSIDSRKYNLYEFTFDKIGLDSELRIKVKQYRYPIINKLKTLRIFDVKSRPTQIQLDGLSLSTNLFTFNSTNQALDINNLNLDMGVDHFMRIRFSL